MSVLNEAFFATVQAGALGQRLCVWHAPTDKAPRGLVVHLHAFAEEMNKARRMVALQARSLADAGFAVLQIDLLGCGDSAGDFGDATWQAWIDDAVAAVRIATERHDQAWPQAQRPTLWLWGHRSGCLLASAAASRLQTPCHFLFWQPTLSGRSVLQQFLRLETAAALMGKEPALKGPSAREVLASGGSPEIAGYRLNPALARSLESAQLLPPASVGATPARVPTCVVWLDLATQPSPTPAPATQQSLTAWTAAGCAVRHLTVDGPAFWQTTEIEDAPALLAATAQTLADGNTASPPQSTPAAFTQPKVLT